MKKIRDTEFEDENCEQTFFELNNNEHDWEEDGDEE